MNIKEFKNEFRLICSDTWGDAMEAWFECVGRMNRRNLEIPANWNYRPGMGSDGTDKESYWYPLFGRCGNKQLTSIANFLERYCRFLKLAGKDY